MPTPVYVYKFKVFSKELFKLDVANMKQEKLTLEMESHIPFGNQTIQTSDSQLFVIGGLDSITSVSSVFMYDSGSN